MPRPPRIEYDGAWYHVLNRGARRQQIFHDNKDRQFLFDLLAEIHTLWNIEVHAYSLMDNHYHLLLHTPNSNLSRGMRYLGAQYTMFYNKKYRKDGPLFRGRFKSILAEKESYLLGLVRYIHLNPVKAGLCNNPLGHRWTSHKAYMDDRAKPDWLVVTDVLAEFSKSYSKARRHLHEFVLSQESPDLIRSIEGQKRVSVLGSTGFKKWIKDNFLDQTPKEKMIPTLRSNRRQNISAGKILDYICCAYQTKPSSVFKRQGQIKNEARSMFVYLLRRINGFSHAMIAEIIDASSTGMVSQLLRRFNKCRKEDPVLSKKANTYLSSLLSHVQS
jgi:putative transposase